MGKFTSETINQIKALAETNIPAYVKSAEADEKGFYALRAELNAHIIQALVGGTITKKKDGTNTMKFNKPLPDKTQVAEISAILQNFITTVEVPFFAELAGEAVEDDDVEIKTVMPGANVAPMEKATNKKLRAAILEGPNAYFRCQLTPVDVATIAGIGEAARKKANLIKFIIIGGVSVAVIGGVAAAVIIHNKKKDEKIEAEVKEEIEVEETEDDIDDIDPDEVPEVELDD